MRNKEQILAHMGFVLDQIAVICRRTVCGAAWQREFDGWVAHLREDERALSQL